MRPETQYCKEFAVLRVCLEGSGVGLGDDSLDIHVVEMFDVFGGERKRYLSTLGDVVPQGHGIISLVYYSLSLCLWKMSPQPSNLPLN